MRRLALVLVLLPALALASGRDGSGNYTLPAGNPVVTGTPIASSWANQTLGDIRDALTASLCRNASCGGMNASLQGYDGTSGNPGYTFASESTSGWYRAGLNDVRFSISSVPKWRCTATGCGAWDNVGLHSIFFAAPTLAADYTLTLPTALPASTLPVTLSSAGALATGQVTGAQIANATITTSNLASVTGSGTVIPTQGYVDNAVATGGHFQGMASITQSSCAGSYSTAGVTMFSGAQIQCYRSGTGITFLSITGGTSSSTAFVTPTSGCALKNGQLGVIGTNCSTGAGADIAYHVIIFN